MESRSQSGMGRENDLQTASNVREESEIDDVVNVPQNRRETSALSPIRTSCTRILRSGTTLGRNAEVKRLRRIPQSRKHGVKGKLSKASTSDEEDGLVTPEVVTSTDKQSGGSTKGLKSPKGQHDVSENISDPNYKKADSMTECKVEKDNDMAVLSEEKNDSRLEFSGKTLNATKASSQGEVPVDKRAKPKSRMENCTVSLLEKQVALNNQTLASKEKLDFKHRDIPEEVFIVSLSKDENKELSVLSTSNGTLHVGSGGIHKRHLAELASTGKSREYAADKVSPSDHDPTSRINHASTEKASWKLDISKRSKTFNLLNAFVDVSKVSVSDANTRTSKAESNACKKSDFGDVTSPVKTKTTHSLIVESKDNKTNARNPTGTATNAQDNISGQSRVMSELGTVQPKGHAESVFESVKSLGYLMSKGFKSSCDKLDKSAKVELKPLSQFPLMEKILTREGHTLSSEFERHSSSGTLKSPVFVTNHTDCDLPGLIKSSSTAPKNCQINEENLHPFKQCVKRSERIRSKSISSDNDMKSVKPKLNNTSHNPAQTKIATAKENGERIDNPKVIPARKPSRHKSTPPSSLAVSSVDKFSANAGSSKPVGATPRKGTPCASKKKTKKKKKRKTVEEIGKVEKKAKDFSKGKACMSQEVMDAIVKSIEETVSRVRKENEEKEEKIGLGKDRRDRGSSLRVNNDNDDALLQTNCFNPYQNDDLGIGKDRDRETATPSGRGNKSSKSTKKSAGSSQRLNQKHAEELRQSNDNSVSKDFSFGGETVNRNMAKEAGAEPGDKSSGNRGKRFRKKTRKAEEALGVQDVFWDCDWPVKKAKTKKRHIASVQESKEDSGQRRSRRGLEKEEQMSDPVLEEHAFMLWASEHRSELEQKLPKVSVSEMDALLSARWCDVANNVKARFFARARDAFSDDDRQLIKAKHLGYRGLPSDAVCGFIMDRDPNFHDFVLLPINRQRDFLRKWLKFFQKMLPRREYVDFIITFKRACGREDSSTFMGKSKRMRMRCLDPAHYQTLFDLIRLSKPRVLEAYRERRGREKKMVSNTYSHMLKTLISGDPWPHMIRGCRSKPLTELLNDLQHLHDQDTGSGPFDSARFSNKGLLSQNLSEKKPCAPDDIELHQDLGALEVTVSLTEQDYSVLDTDFALGLMSDLSKLDELPVLDQSLLDEVLQPACQTTPLSLLQAQGNDVNCLFNAGNINNSCTLNTPRCRIDPLASPFPCQPVANASNCAMTPYTGHMCPPNMALSDSMACPKINIHYRSSLPSSNRLMHCSYPGSHSTAVVSYRMCHADQSSGFTTNKNKVRSCAYMGGQYNTSAPASKSIYESIRENMMHDPGESVTGRCIKVHQRHNQSQVRMSARPYQVPISSLAPQSKFHPKSITLPYGSQQKIASDISCRQGMVMMNSSPLSKLDQAYLHHNPSGCRINSPSPLITSLSPFRAIKSSAQRSKGQHCQVLPHKSKIHCASSSYHSDNQTFWKTATAHAIPISTSLRPCGSLTSPRPQNNMGQIKVCLPTQALKIPIAKLRGARKTAFVKGRMKSIHLSQATLTHRPDATVSCQSPHSLVSRQNNQSVLAKVLSFQSGPENEVFNTGISTSSSTAPPLLRSSLCPSLMTVSKRNPHMQITSNAYINSGCNSSSSSSSDKPNSHLHLMTKMNPHANTTSLGPSKISGSGQTAVIINPLHLQRRPLLPSKCSIDRSHQIQEVPKGTPPISKDIRLVNYLGANDFNLNVTCGGHSIHKPRSDIMPDMDRIQMYESNDEKRDALVDEQSEEGKFEELPILELMADTNEGNGVQDHEQHGIPVDDIRSQQFNDGGNFLCSEDGDQAPSDGNLSMVLTKVENSGSPNDSECPRGMFLQPSPRKDVAEENQDDDHKESTSTVNALMTDSLPLKDIKESDILSDPEQNVIISGYTRHKNSQSDIENCFIPMVTEYTNNEKVPSDENQIAVTKYEIAPDCFAFEGTVNSVTEAQYYQGVTKDESCTGTSTATCEHGLATPERPPSCTQHPDDCTSTVDEMSAAISMTCQTSNGRLFSTSPPATCVSQNDQFQSAAAGSEATLQTYPRASNDSQEASNNSPTRPDGSIPDTDMASRELSCHNDNSKASVHSPVKRSDSVVRHSPVFSQIMEVTTPVTTSRSCRLSIGVFPMGRADERESLQCQRKSSSPRRSPAYIPHTNPEEAEDEILTLSVAEAGPVMSNSRNDAQSPPSTSTSVTNEKGHSFQIKTVKVTAISDLLQRAEPMKLESASITQATTTYNTSQTLSQTVTTYCLENVPLVSTSASNMATAVSILHDNKGNPSAGLQAVPVSDGMNHAKTNPVTMVKRTIQSTKALNITVTHCPVTSCGDTGPSLSSPCRKRAHYVHEYLPT